MIHFVVEIRKCRLSLWDLCGWSMKICPKWQGLAWNNLVCIIANNTCLWFLLFSLICSLAVVLFHFHPCQNATSKKYLFIKKKKKRLLHISQGVWCRCLTSVTSTVWWHFYSKSIGHTGSGWLNRLIFNMNSFHYTN